MSPKLSAIDKARRAWPGALPDWVEQLARLCDRKSMNAITRQLDYSQAVISQIINGKYNGDLKAVERAVRGAVMQETVSCPVVGDLAVDLCHGHQKRSRCTSPMDFMFYRACRNGCPHSNVTAED